MKVTTSAGGDGDVGFSDGHELAGRWRNNGGVSEVSSGVSQYIFQ